MNIKFSHEYWMRYAIQLAQQAENKGEVPIGAVLVYDDQVIGEGYNQPISCYDPTAHAEIKAIRQGGLILKNYRLLESVLYVTLEPCIMCLGAIIHGRIKTIVYGAHNDKISTVESMMSILRCQEANHCAEVISGVLAPECLRLLRDFFRTRRLKKERRADRRSELED